MLLSYFFIAAAFVLLPTTVALLPWRTRDILATRDATARLGSVVLDAACTVYRRHRGGK
jgi:hypothetical protein